MHVPGWLVTCTSQRTGIPKLQLTWGQLPAGFTAKVLQVSTEMKTDTLGGRSALSPECWVKQHCELQVDRRKTPPEPPSFSRPPQGGSHIGKLTLTLSTTRMYSS